MAKGKGGFLGHDGLNAPDAPTSVSASGGDTQATVSFTAPSDVGGSAITGYVATSNDGIGATGTSSPITVTGLTNGTSYTFNVWAINGFGWSVASATSSGTTPVATIGLFGGGNTSSGNVNTIQSITISTEGNASDFGDLTVARSEAGACASSTRGVFAGAYSNTVIDYVTIASAGNAIDFGDLLSGHATKGLSNNTRGIFSAETSSLNQISYITIATTGNATDFGDFTVFRRYGISSCASPTRGLFGGGYPASNSWSNVIDYVTIATTGNTTDFGDLTIAREALAACSSSTRALFGGGDGSGPPTNTIDYVTIATTGNATDFGDLTTTPTYNAATSSTTRGIFAGGYYSGYSNTIAYVTIATTGNASDFGDLLTGTYSFSGCSNGHGGLS